MTGVVEQYLSPLAGQTVWTSQALVSVMMVKLYSAGHYRPLSSLSTRDLSLGAVNERYI